MNPSEIMRAEQEPEISIEEAAPEDAAEIGYVQQEGWLATYPDSELGITKEDILAKDFLSEEKTKKRAERLRTQEDAKVWVAREDGHVIGFCVARLGEAQNRIDALYILSDYHGKGIGKRLLQTALEWLGAEKDVQLGVASHNNHAISFYGRFGFEKTKEIHHDSPTFPLAGKDMPEIEMILSSRNKPS